MKEPSLHLCIDGHVTKLQFGNILLCYVVIAGPFHTAQGRGVGASTFKPLPVMYCVGAAGARNHLPKLILVPTANTSGSVLFHAGGLFSIDNAYFGPIWLFCRKFRHFSVFL